MVSDKTPICVLDALCGNNMQSRCCQMLNEKKNTIGLSRVEPTAAESEWCGLSDRNNTYLNKYTTG